VAEDATERAALEKELPVSPLEVCWHEVWEHSGSCVCVGLGRHKSSLACAIQMCVVQVTILINHYTVQTCVCACAVTHAHTYTRSHARAHTHTHTHTHPHSQTQTHTRTHTHMQSGHRPAGTHGSGPASPPAHPTQRTYLSAFKCIRDRILFRG